VMSALCAPLPSPDFICRNWGSPRREVGPLRVWRSHTRQVTIRVTDSHLELRMGYVLPMAQTTSVPMNYGKYRTNWLRLQET